jgi:sugar O-acyltransferase (sialic acid O-acetyltransferase NeuD family)
MTKAEVVIFGVGKIAQVIYAYSQDRDTNFQVAGFCVDADYKKVDEMFGLPVVRWDDVTLRFPPKRYKMLVAIGYHQMNRVRAEKCSQALAAGYKLTNFVHSKAYVSSMAVIGDNCIVLDNVSVEPFVEIGDNVCLYSNATVAHHAKIGKNCWVASGTVIGGNSTVSRNCFLGINSTIGHNMTIGEENFIGAGTVVTKCTGAKEVHIQPDTPNYRLNVDLFLKLFKFD